MHLAKNERDQAEATRRPAVDEPSTPTKRDRFVELCEPTFAKSGGFEAKIESFEWLGQLQIAPSNGERQSRLAADVHRRPAPGAT